MVKFLDGPAAGVTLGIRRAAKMLRVVRGPDGKWDALDQLDDEPLPGEEIFVYVMEGRHSMMHLCVRGKNRAAGGWYVVAEFRFLAEQPAEADMRDTAAWRKWCEAHRAKFHSHEFPAPPDKTQIQRGTT